MLRIGLEGMKEDDGKKNEIGLIKFDGIKDVQLLHSRLWKDWDWCRLVE